MSQQEAWAGFVGGNWEHEIDVRDFIQKNYTPYDGDESFLAEPTENTTQALWIEVMEPLSPRSARRAASWTWTPDIVSTHHSPTACGLHRPRTRRRSSASRPTSRFKRALMPYGGIRMAVAACEQNGYRAGPGDRGHSSRTTARPTTTASLTPTPRRCAPARHSRHHHRPARRLRPRPHHRRLPPCRPLRRRPPHRGKEGSGGRRHRAAMNEADASATARSSAEQIRALEELKPMARQDLRLRHLPARPRTPRRPSSGSTSAISPRSRSRTAPPCAWAAPPPSWTSTPSATWQAGVITEERGPGA